MNCRRAKKLIFEFVDGLNDEKLKLDLEQHLGECAECDHFATSLTGSLALIRRSPQEPVDENFNWKVRLAIHKERREMQELASSQGSLFRAWNLRYAMSAAAGFATILAAGWLTVSLTFPSPPGGSQSTSTPTTARMEASDVPARGDSPRFSKPTLVTGPGRMVSGGNNAGSSGGGGGGAIDVEKVVHNPAAFDSLFEVQLRNLPEDMRAQILRQHLMMLQKRLEACSPQGVTPAKEHE